MAVARAADAVGDLGDRQIGLPQQRLGVLDRDRLRRALTPQAFRHEILTEAFRDADLSETVTDECYLVEKLRVPIAVVEGSPRNIKITHPRDFALAEFYLGQEQLS